MLNIDIHHKHGYIQPCDILDLKSVRNVSTKLAKQTTLTLGIIL